MKRLLEIQVTIVFCMLITLLTPTVAFAQQGADAVLSPAEAQIVGGQQAARNEFPWQAMLFNPSGMHVCSGSLIRNNWVLTAAHCLDNAGIATVTLGGYDKNDSNEAGHQTFSVKRVIIHPDFNVSTLVNDIGLIELNGSAVESENVKIISMVGIADFMLMQPGTEAVVSGWGAEVEGGWMSAVLNKVTVPLVGSEICAQAYGSMLQDGMTCAGYVDGGMDSCSGDSGGPLMVPDNAGGMKLAGVVSWGRGCARANAYGIYSNVPFFTGWIMEHLDNGDDGSDTTPTTDPAQGGNGKQQTDTQATNTIFLPVIANQ